MSLKLISQPFTKTPVEAGWTTSKLPPLFKWLFYLSALFFGNVTNNIHVESPQNPKYFSNFNHSSIPSLCLLCVVRVFWSKCLVKKENHWFLITNGWGIGRPSLVKSAQDFCHHQVQLHQWKMWLILHIIVFLLFDKSPLDHLRIL